MDGCFQRAYYSLPAERFAAQLVGYSSFATCLAFGKSLLGGFDIFDRSNQRQSIVAAKPGIAMGHQQLTVTADCQRQQTTGKIQLAQRVDTWL